MTPQLTPAHQRDVKASAWTPDEWSAIVWHALNARLMPAKGPLPCPPRKSAQRLRELALQTEIDGVRACH